MATNNNSAPETLSGQLLNAIRSRKFGNVARLFAPGVDFQAWTPVGHWVANDGQTASRIIEVWYSPGAGPSTVVTSEETHGRGWATLEFEMTWHTQPEDQPRVLRQVYLLTTKADKDKGERITAARVYCAGLHTEFPEVDLERQRRAKGIGGVKPPAPRAVAAKAS